MKVKNKERLLVSASIILGIALWITVITMIFGDKKEDCEELGKAELIDIAIKKHVKSICYDEMLFKECVFEDEANETNMVCYGEEWDIKSNDAQCSLSFESLKREAPHCFTGQRSDTCYGVVTHFDFDKKETVKSEINIYKYKPFRFPPNWLIDSDRRFYQIATELDYDDMDNNYIVSQCGTAKCFGCWN